MWIRQYNQEAKDFLYKMFNDMDIVKNIKLIEHNSLHRFKIHVFCDKGTVIMVKGLDRKEAHFLLLNSYWERSDVDMYRDSILHK